MRSSVRLAFVEFSARFEGVVPWMYLDVLGLVTVGIGNLVDPISAALSLPFVRPDGSPATRDEIAAEWQRVKSHPTAAKQGHRVLKGVTSLRLTPEGIERVVYGKLDLNEAELRRRFPAWDSWPADAQLATHSMAWACGAWFRFPRLADALNALDFEEAERQCRINEKGNPGVAPRNIANKAMYRNAACIVGMRLDPEPLYYPRDLTTVDRAADTLRVLPDDDQPSRRPPVVEDFAKVRGPTPLGRPEIDADLPTTPPDEDAQS